MSLILRCSLGLGCFALALQRGNQRIQNGFQVLRAFTEHAFDTFAMYGKFANLPGDVSIDINPHRPGPITSRRGFVVGGDPGKRIVEASRDHPVDHKFLNMSSATGAADAILPGQLGIPLQDFQFIFPSILRQQEPQPASRFFVSTNRAKVFSYLLHVMPPFIEPQSRQPVRFVRRRFVIL